LKEFNKIVFSTQNVIWICSLAISNVITIQTLRSDIRDINTSKKFEIEKLQYQIDELKKCAKYIAYSEKFAILPKEIEIEKQNAK
jgi:hypothetical protein